MRLTQREREREREKERERESPSCFAYCFDVFNQKCVFALLSVV